MLSHFYTILERDGQTDRQTDRQNCCISIARHWRAVKTPVIVLGCVTVSAAIHWYPVSVEGTSALRASRSRLSSHYLPIMANRSCKKIDLRIKNIKTGFISDAVAVLAKTFWGGAIISSRWKNWGPGQKVMGPRPPWPQPRTATDPMLKNIKKHFPPLDIVKIDQAT